MNKTQNLFLLLVLAASPAFAASENIKGMLSEISMDGNEAGNQKKSFESEVMITKAENRAIEALKKVIQKKSGRAEEADLQFRLAELYMRRAKSGRFFDLDTGLQKKLQEHGLNSQRATDGLKKAIDIYHMMIRRFPKYVELDYVFFNNALANIQIKETEVAKKNYLQLISAFPKSDLIPDALLEVGEIYYNQQNFSASLDKFKAIEKFPESKAYPYGLYKSAWALYNLRQTDDAIAQMLLVVKENPADSGDGRKYNLRKESLRDLTLFVGENLAPDKIFGFFEKITTEAELGEIIYALSDLYESHSRFKEISVFANKYITEYPKNSHAPKLYAKLIHTFETLKQREMVLKKLEAMAEFCVDAKDNTCKDEFRKISLDISKKWWDIWLKNKSNKEFSQLTEKAFENLLSLDSADAPDSKSRYAYAELLFQQGKFEAAATQYELVSNHSKIDKNLAHDALYGALFSIEKNFEKTETAQLTAQQKELALRYISQFKNGEHVTALTFKLGFIAYKQADYDLALNYLNPLIKNPKNGAIKVKAEDIILDIYNIRKDYVTIQKTAKTILASTSDNTRSAGLNRIVEESHYSQLLIDSKNLEVNKKIDLLVAFANEHKTKMGQDSFWQAISLAYSNGLDVRGANLTLDYIKQHPNDPRKKDALKDAVKAFIDSANLGSAVATLKMSDENSELICDLQKVDGKTAEARNCYNRLFKKVDQDKKAALLTKLLGTFSNKNSPEYADLQNQILASNVEPYSTEILITQAQRLLEAKDYPKAFALSLKINARPVDEDFRAEARLIQARILEIEFVSQSVKAREDKLSMVIAMKTEKLDKSFTAYSSAIKMSKSEKIQAEGLRGIDRLYTHYVNAVTNMPMPETLAPADQKALSGELAKIAESFDKKRESNLEQLRKVSKLSATESQSVNWDEFSVEKSVEPLIRFPQASKLSQLLIRDFNNESSAIERSVASTGKCDTLNRCLQNRKFDQAQKMALDLTATKEKRHIGLYYLSLIADAQNEFDKSLWLLNKASELNKNLSLLNYEKAKVLYNVEGINSSLNYFGKAVDMKDVALEVRVILAIKSFSDREYAAANEDFSRLSIDQNYTYGVDLLHIESTLKLGDTNAALLLAEKYASINSKRVELHLQFARIFETFLQNKDKASLYYKKALADSEDTQLKNWILRKIDFLKQNKNNQITSYVGGEL